jgi:hypothetical protein
MYNTKQCVSIVDRRTQVNNRKYVLWQQRLKQKHSAEDLVRPCLSFESCQFAVLLRYTSTVRAQVRAVIIIVELPSHSPPHPPKSLVIYL